MDLLVTICCNCVNSEDFVDETGLTINVEVKNVFWKMKDDLKKKI